MKEKGQNRDRQNGIDEKVKTAFGTDESQLAEMYERIAAQKESSGAPPAPEGELEKILARIERSYGKEKDIP